MRLDKLISMKYAKELVKKGKAKMTGVSNDGINLYEIIERIDYQCVQHVFLERIAK